MTAATAARARVTIAARIRDLAPARAHRWHIGTDRGFRRDDRNIRDGTGKPETRSIDGHALDFGEVVVRQAA